MGLLKTLAQHRADEYKALQLRDKLTDLEKTTPERIKNTNSYKRKVEDIKDEIDAKSNHSKFPSKAADSIHQLRKFKSSKRKRQASNSKQKGECND